MVDVSAKPPAARAAVAKGRVLMQPATAKLIKSRRVKKGDVLGAARLAGIMAAKRTADVIPLCHPLALSAVSVDLTCRARSVDITASCKVTGATGVEMEALMAVTAAALTVYDMCKAVDRGMHITDIRLVKKSGGKSGTFTQD